MNIIEKKRVVLDCYDKAVTAVAEEFIYQARFCGEDWRTLPIEEMDKYSDTLYYAGVKSFYDWEPYLTPTGRERHKLYKDVIEDIMKNI